MGGEETEIGEATTTRPARGRELRAVRDLPHLRAPAPPHRGLEPLGEGRRPATSPSRPPTSRPRSCSSWPAARWTADSDVQGDLPERPVIALPARARRRGDRHRDAARAPVRAPRAGSASTATAASVVAPTWRARDVTREIDVVEEIARFRLEDVPFTLPARREMFGALTRDQQLRRRVEDALVGLGLRRDLHAEPAARRRHAVEAPRADLGRADGAPHVAAAEPRRGGAPQRRRRRARDRAVRDRARLPAGAATCPTSASDRRRDRRGRLPAREGRRRGAVRARSRPSRRSSAPSTRCSIPARPRAPTRASSASCIRACSKASGARSSSTSRSLFDAVARAGDLPRRDHLSRPSARTSPSPCRRRSPVGELVAAAREAAGDGAARDPRLRRLPRRAGRRGPQVGRVLGRLPVGRAARSPRRTRRACATRSSPRSPSGSAPSSAPDAAGQTRIRPRRSVPDTGPWRSSPSPGSCDVATRRHAARARVDGAPCRGCPSASQRSRQRRTMPGEAP